MSRTIERALLLLQVVSRSDHPLGLMEVVEHAGLDKSTTARLLQSLTKFGLVARDPDSRKYDLGLGLLSLAASVTRGSELLRSARPLLQRLRELSEETATLHVRADGDRVCIDGVESWHPIRRVAALGEAHPLYLSPTGKVILAFLSQGEVTMLLERGKQAGLDVAQVQEQLTSARSHGYLAAVGDRTPGVAAISAPLFDRHGVMGSITVAGPAERWTPERMDDFAPTLRAVTTQLSAALGSSDQRRWTDAELLKESV